MQKILVLSPHPDDDVLGCGGTIKLHTLSGHKVKVIYLTSGEAGGVFPSVNSEEISRIRRKEAFNALNFLSPEIEHLFLNGEDGNLSRYDKNLLNDLVLEMRRYQPEVVYLPHKYDSHRDHIETFHIGMEAINRAGSACFPEIKQAPWYGIKRVYSYEVWTPLQEYHLTIDITRVVENKRQSILFHKSQISNQDFSEGILSLNRYRGIMTGIGGWAEVFRIEKFSPVDGLV
jgi:LmbE family N-acetylglucosaminyl deacetylase